VRWNTSSSSTTGAISGMNCTALAPVPMTATALAREVDVVAPAGRVERPAREVPKPSMSVGKRGRLSCRRR
jgi:hypothetical protein